MKNQKSLKNRTPVGKSDQGRKTQKISKKGLPKEKKETTPKQEYKLPKQEKDEALWSPLFPIMLL